MGLGPGSPGAESLLYQHLSSHGHSVLSPPCLGHCFKLHLPGIRLQGSSTNSHDLGQMIGLTLSVFSSVR